MGMFDKDKEIGILLQNWIPLNTPFIVWDVKIIREDFPTDIGLAVQSGLTVSKVDTPNDKYDVTTLASAIAAKVREADAADFPAVVQTQMVQSRYGVQQALVMSFLKPYTGPGARSRPAPGDGFTPRTDTPDPLPADAGQQGGTAF